MKKQILVSGLRATSEPHIGNYLGAIRQFIEKQDDYDCYFFIADLHTMTTPFEPKELRKSSLAVLADYIALGLDPKKSTIFLQSQVPQHTELAWIFNCITPVSELQRMTQFKDKASETNAKSINAGLLNYPVLMAADVLLYKGEVVPVGDDQVQHLELSRIISRKFNNAFGKVFPEPKPLLNKTARVMSLTEPTKKMSKTGGAGILLNDSPEEIKKKLRKAVTATDAKGKSAGVDNLMGLLKEFGTEGQYEFFQSQLKDNTIQFSHLKDALAEVIANHFAKFREKRAKLLADPEYLAEVLADGARKAQSIANKTISEVKEKVGLL
ncbi:MAG: tryptophanyl-tRNA synthetase [Candidatus Doudnabacteria bacterium Gr01-1014_77]|uniref:Tryptophan--tRNA ligase n=1 Tax=Candidatus Doudnabacteria bacterium Gr01-1014_77 TaxID=2017133 RepID=A0A554JBK8_9BACT|nr:MAG: tryptophanyl-tRNA synthetase [Candidatus Doudnabacteria bacterium Gr01-1014_77]